MGKLRIHRLGYALGARVEGLDLSKGLDDDTIDEIQSLWFEHIVLCFPGQNLELDAMTKFCGRFGTLDDNRNAHENRDADFPHVKVVTNRPVSSAKGYSGERLGTIWHTDQSFTLFPSTATFLHAKALPDVGGDTMFANAYRAYETLSPAMQKLLEGLEGVHDQALSGESWDRKSPEERAAAQRRSPPVVHPIVRVHPETGRKTLYINPRVRQFVGMTEEESRPLVDFLNRHSIAYELVYRHRWTLGDLMMWDNRCATHKAIPDFDPRQTRRMLRCSLLGPKSGRVYEAVPAEVAAGAA